MQENAITTVDLRPLQKVTAEMLKSPIIVMKISDHISITTGTSLCRHTFALGSIRIDIVTSIQLLVPTIQIELYNKDKMAFRYVSNVGRKSYVIDHQNAAMFISETADGIYQVANTVTPEAGRSICDMRGYVDVSAADIVAMANAASSTMHMMTGALKAASARLVNTASNAANINNISNAASASNAANINNAANASNAAMTRYTSLVNNAVNSVVNNVTHNLNTELGSYHQYGVLIGSMQAAGNVVHANNAANAANTYPNTRSAASSSNAASANNAASAANAANAANTYPNTRSAATANNIMNILNTAPVATRNATGSGPIRNNIHQVRTAPYTRRTSPVSPTLQPINNYITKRTMVVDAAGNHQYINPRRNIDAVEYIEVMDTSYRIIVEVRDGINIIASVVNIITGVQIATMVPTGCRIHLRDQTLWCNHAGMVLK